MKKRHIFFYPIVFISLFYSCWAWAAPHYAINVVGVTGDLLTNIKARLQVEQDALAQSTSVDKVERFYQRLPTIVATAMQPYGYFAPTITCQRQWQAKGWQFTVRVNQGKAIHITALHIKVHGEGATDPALTAYPL